MLVLWDNYGMHAARDEGVARALVNVKRITEAQLTTLQNTDAINHEDDFNHKPRVWVSEWNLCWQMRLIHNFTDFLNESRRYVSFAPLAHSSQTDPDV